MHQYTIMKYENSHLEPLLAIKVALSKQQKAEAKLLARKRHMTFSGWVGSLIERELEQNSTQEANR